MAAVTSAVVAVGSAGYQIYSSEKSKSDAKNALEEFNRQEITNPFENLQIDTEKSEQQTDAALSAMATSVDAAQRGGARVALGSIPRLNENNILLQNLISQDIREQQRERDLLIAKGEQNIQNIRERREEGALQGIGQQIQTARQDTMSGIGNLVSSGLSFASIYNQDLSIDEEEV